MEDRKADYLAFPYLNKKVDRNLILWQQVYALANAFPRRVAYNLKKDHFSDFPKPDRPFSVFGYVDNGDRYGSGWDIVFAKNVCGFSDIRLDNIYISRIQKHFSCGLDVANEPKIQLALRAIKGLDIASLSEAEKEHAAKAIACGYLYREGDMLYTKILVSPFSENGRLFAISDTLQTGYFDADAEIVAEKLAALIRKSVPDYLLGEWRLANNLASLPMLDSVVEYLIEKGILTPPENGIGAEGCWMSVQK